MPWLQPGFTSLDKVLCRVLTITHLFPSQRSLALIQQFGKEASDVVQTPQMVTRVELQVVKSERDMRAEGLSFTVDLVPIDSPDFLVLHHEFH